MTLINDAALGAGMTIRFVIGGFTSAAEAATVQAVMSTSAAEAAPTQKARKQLASLLFLGISTEAS